METLKGQIRQGNDFVPTETKQEMKQRTSWGELLETSPSETRGEMESMPKPDW